MLEHCFQNDELDPRPQVGELVIKNGQRSMCVARRVHYSGGMGPLWATEHREAYARLSDFSYPGDIRVFCERVNPRRKTVRLRVLDGPTWGTAAIGSRINVHASRIERYQDTNSTDRDWSKLSAATELAQRAKQKLDAKNLLQVTEDFEVAYNRQLASMIGEDQAKRCHDALREYAQLVKLVHDSGGWFANHPTKEVRQAAKRLARAMGGPTPTTSGAPDQQKARLGGRS